VLLRIGLIQLTVNLKLYCHIAGVCYISHVPEKRHCNLVIWKLFLYWFRNLYIFHLQCSYRLQIVLVI